MTGSDSAARARVVIVEDGRVALIRRVRDGRTYHLFPGGGVEPGETPQAAAVREAREELGVDVRLSGLVHSELFEGVRFLYYRAAVVGGEFGTGLWPDHAGRGEGERAAAGTYEPVWVPLGELAGGRVALDVRPQALVERLLGGA